MTGLSDCYVNVSLEGSKDEIDFGSLEAALHLVSLCNSILSILTASCCPGSQAEKCFYSTF